MIDDAEQPLLDNEKNIDVDEDLDKEINRKIRNGFISKVLGIIFYQLIITTIVISLALFNNNFKHLLLTSTFLYVISIIATFVIVLLPICYKDVFRSVPTNYILLTIFTLCLSYIVAIFTCQFTPRSVLVILGLTIIIVGGLTIYALTTKNDFTFLGGMLCVCLLTLIFSGLILIFFPIPFLYLLYDIGGLIIFSIYLIFDIQLLVGDRGIKFSEDEYMLAAMNIYLDIINIFIKLLSIFGKRE